MNKLPVFEVSTRVDAHNFYRTVFTTQPSFVIAQHLARAQPFENVFDDFAVGVEVDDVAADVLFACVSEQIELSLVCAKDRSLSADPMQTGRGVFKKVG